MIIYVLRRIALLTITLLILAATSYWLVYIFPGDPVANLSGINYDMIEQISEIEAHYYADQDQLNQFIRYLELLWLGDWGVSFVSGEPLFFEIRIYLPASLELGAYALTLSLIFGIPMGFIAGLNHNKSPDITIRTASLIGYSVPVSWFALSLVVLFSLQYTWFPISGRVSLLYDIPQETGFILYDILISDVKDKQEVIINALSHLVLPTISIAVVTCTVIMRTTRRLVINVMSSDYIQAAYAKGLTGRQVLLKHGLRNVLLPLMPHVVMQFTTLLTNAMIVETIFAWPGIGNWLIQAIYTQDYPAIRAGMLAVSGLVVMITVIADIIHMLIDPTRMYEKGVKN